jgi:threonine dehydrogenase-like Zn-dependent dehydrogenase
MRALQLNRQTLTLTEIPPPDAPDEALIRVLRAGICGTDVAMTQGYAGFSGTLGHEFVGVVERAPDPAWIGRRVVGDINVGCGHCRQCVGGDARHCALRRVLGIRARDGAFAEYLSLPLRNVHVVPDVITNRAAVFAETASWDSSWRRRCARTGVIRSWSVVTRRNWNSPKTLGLT